MVAAVELVVVVVKAKGVDGGGVNESCAGALACFMVSLQMAM